MSLNLMDLVKDQMSSQIIGKLSGLVGESAGSTGSALTSFIPTLMGGVAEKASTSEGAAGLMDMFKSSAESGIGDNLEGALSGDTSELMNSGKGMLEGIMGDKLGGMTSALSGASGMSTGALSKLMSLAGPMIMGIVGKNIMSQGLDVSGLQGLMSSQADNISGAMPSGLMDKLGLGSLGGLAAGAAGLAGAAGSGLSGALGSAGDAVSGAAGAVTGAAGNVVDGAGDLAGKGVDALKGAAGSVGSAAGSVVDGAGDLAGKGVDAVKGAAGAVTGAAGSVVEGAGDLAGAGVGAAKSGLRWLWGLLPLIAVCVLGWWLLTKGCSGTVDAVKDTTSGVVNKAGDAAKGAAGAVGDAAGSVGDAAKGAAGAVGDAAKKGAGAVGNAAGAVGDAAKGAADATGNAIKKGAGAVRDAAGNIKLPSGDILKFDKGSFGDKLATSLMGKGKPGQSFTIDNLNFASGQAVIPNAAKANLKSTASLLKAYPNVVIALEGHTDSQGNAASNTKLSQSRADAVKAFLLSSGVPANQLQGARGFGSVKPVATNDTAAGRAQNRRTELKIVKR